MDAAPLVDPEAQAAAPCRPPGDMTRDHIPRQLIRSPEPVPKLDLRFPTATKSVESPLSRSSKYHLNGNLRNSRALSIGLICARYRILGLCQSRSSWRPTETRDDTFMGPLSRLASSTAST